MAPRPDLLCCARINGAYCWNSLPAPLTALDDLARDDRAPMNIREVRLGFSLEEPSDFFGRFCINTLHRDLDPVDRGYDFDEHIYCVMSDRLRLGTVIPTYLAM
jgi:hypothetical protein